MTTRECRAHAPQSARAPWSRLLALPLALATLALVGARCDGAPPPSAGPMPAEPAPPILWQTFLGGLADQGRAVAIDGSGNLYLTGETFSSWGTPVRPLEGEIAAFVAKLDAKGAVVWNTFLGGKGRPGDRGSTHGFGIAVDAHGGVYVVGRGNTSWGRPVRAYSAGDDAFAAKLDAATGELLWNTFLGGADGDEGLGIAADRDGGVYLAGRSGGPWGRPVRAYSAGADAFVAKLAGASGALVWSTFLGGRENDQANAIAVDGNGNLLVAGASGGAWGSPVRGYTEGGDAFVAKLSAATGALAWNTFLGGAKGDFGQGVAVDAGGAAYLVGVSAAPWGSPVRAYTAGLDAFVAKVDPAGALIWNTFLGGTGQDMGIGIAVDAGGRLYVTGIAGASWGKPTRAHSGQSDSFAAKLDPSGAMLWNTFLGGSKDDYGQAVALDASGGIYLCGTSLEAWGSNPVQDFWGLRNTFVAKLGVAPPVPESPLVTALRRAAVNGDAGAQYHLARRLAFGDAGNPAEAVTWCRKAAEQGQQDAQELLARLLSLGRGAAVNGPEAVQWWRKAAEKDQVAAEVALADAYRLGQGGLAVDKAAAVAWYKRAAAHGSAVAEDHLGEAYEEGQGVPQDHAEASRWFEEAGRRDFEEEHRLQPERVQAVREGAERGEPAAQFEFARRVQWGADRATGDRREALDWCRRAAEQGHRQAQELLAYMLQQGRRPNLEEAARWMRAAAEQGSPQAQDELGEFYRSGHRGLPRDGAVAVSWYRRAAEHGRIFGLDGLGRAYAQGDGVPRDDRLAVAWYRRAADLHSVYGALELAKMVESGRGVAAGPRAAVELYRQAADHNLPEAQEALALRYQAGRGVPTSLACAYLWYSIAAKGDSETAAAERDKLTPRLSAEELADAKRMLARTSVESFKVVRPLCPDERLDLSLTNEDLSSVLPALEQVSGYRIANPAKLDFKVTVQLKDVSWQDALTAVLSPHGYRWKRDGDAILMVAAPRGERP